MNHHPPAFSLLIPNGAVINCVTTARSNSIASDRFAETSRMLPGYVGMSRGRLPSLRDCRQVAFRRRRRPLRESFAFARSLSFSPIT